MAGTDWLAGGRTELAADRILDAAARLFAEHGPATVGMNDISRAAGCSRATLYRYFENRDALHTAYVHRWANEIGGDLAARMAGIDDPHQRLLAGITEAIASVRGNPALLSWFAETGPPIGAAMADRSEVITAMVARFLATLGPADAEALQRRARWLVRVMTSLLIFPGRDAAEERALLEEFVTPVVAPARRRPAPHRE